MGDNLKQVEMDTGSPRKSVTVYQKSDIIFEEKNTGIWNVYPASGKVRLVLGKVT